MEDSWFFWIPCLYSETWLKHPVSGVCIKGFEQRKNLSQPRLTLVSKRKTIPNPQVLWCMWPFSCIPLLRVVAHGSTPALWYSACRQKGIPKWDPTVSGSIQGTRSLKWTTTHPTCPVWIVLMVSKFDLSFYISLPCSSGIVSLRSKFFICLLGKAAHLDQKSSWENLILKGKI